MVNYLQNAWQSYLEEWIVTSEFFVKEGHYDWCAKHIGEKSSVLEIGLGIGNSAISLLKKGCKIVSIEENLLCIERAADNIQKNCPIKLNYGIVQRSEEISFENGKYDIAYCEIEDFTSKDFSLAIIEGNFPSDKILINWLQSLPKFDFITCWFTGTHGAIMQNKVAIADNPTDYRIGLHKQIFDLAKLFLRDNGTLNFCDRAISLSQEKQIDFANYLSNFYKAEENNLFLSSVKFKEVTKFNIPDGMEHRTKLSEDEVQNNSIFSVSFTFKQ